MILAVVAIQFDTLEQARTWASDAEELGGRANGELDSTGFIDQETGREIEEDD